MDDIEMVKLCAAAMGLEVREVTMNAPEHTIRLMRPSGIDYWPFKNDEQAMALVKRFRLDISALFSEDKDDAWMVRGTVSGWERTQDVSLNRAIVACVAKMQQKYPVRTPLKTQADK